MIYDYVNVFLYGGSSKNFNIRPSAGDVDPRVGGIIDRVHGFVVVNIDW